MILEELAKDGIPSQVSNLDSDPRPEPTNNQPTTEICHSGRTSRLPRFYMSESQDFQSEIHEHEEEDPLTYDEAVESVDSKLWQEAMNTEMASMDTNTV